MPAQVDLFLQRIKEKVNPAQLLPLVSAGAVDSFIAALTANQFVAGGVENTLNELKIELDDSDNTQELTNLRQAAAERLIQLRINTIEQANRDILSKISAAKNNEDLFRVLSLGPFFSDLHISNLNFSPAFSEAVKRVSNTRIEAIIDEAVVRANNRLRELEAVYGVTGTLKSHLDTQINAGMVKTDADAERVIRAELFKVRATGTETDMTLLVNTLPAEAVDRLVKDLKKNILVQPLIAPVTQKATESIDAVLALAASSAGLAESIGISASLTAIEAIIGPDTPFVSTTAAPNPINLHYETKRLKQAMEVLNTDGYKAAKAKQDSRWAITTQVRGSNPEPAEITNFKNAENLYKLAERKLSFAIEQKNNLERQLVLVESAQSKLQALQQNPASSEDELKIILEQQSIVTNAQKIAKDAYNQTRMTELDAAEEKNATTGYIFNQNDAFKPETTKITGVVDIVSEAQAIIKRLNSPFIGPVKPQGLQSSVHTDKPVHYVSGHVEKNAFYQTTDKLNTGVLYLARDMTTETITDLSVTKAPVALSRTPSQDDVDRYNSDTASYHQDLINQAFTHARDRLNAYKEGQTITISAIGRHDAASANRLYAAILVVADDLGIKRPKIESKVFGCDGPEAGLLYGKNDKKFINDHLGKCGFKQANTANAERTQFAEAYRHFKAEEGGSKKHGDVTEYVPPTPKPGGQ